MLTWSLNNLHYSFDTKTNSFLTTKDCACLQVLSILLIRIFLCLQPHLDHLLDRVVYGYLWCGTYTAYSLVNLLWGFVLPDFFFSTRSITKWCLFTFLSSIPSIDGHTGSAHIPAHSMYGSPLDQFGEDTARILYPHTLMPLKWCWYPPNTWSRKEHFPEGWSLVLTQT